MHCLLTSAQQHCSRPHVPRCHMASLASCLARSAIKEPLHRQQLGVRPFSHVGHVPCRQVPTSRAACRAPLQKRLHRQLPMQRTHTRTKFPCVCLCGFQLGATSHPTGAIPAQVLAHHTGTAERAPCCKREPSMKLRQVVPGLVQHKLFPSACAYMHFTM